jgi:spore coat protein U-like protein
MHRIVAYPVIMLALMGVNVSPAHACSLGVDVVGPTSWNGADGRGYDVFDAAVYYQPLGFRIQSLDEPCAFYVTVSATVGGGAAGALSGVGASLVYEVYRDASGAQAMRPAPLATQSEVLTGTVSKQSSASFQVAYSILALQIVPPGTYSGEITISAYEGLFGAGLLRVQKQVPLTITIPSIAELSFAENTFDVSKKHVAVNFGTLHQGAIKGVNVRARGNGGYRITASSLNGGVMRQPDPLERSEVPYSLRIDGKHVNLNKSDVEAAIAQGITSARGNSHRLDFEIGSLAGASAGDYEDTITLVITSLR